MSHAVIYQPQKGRPGTVEIVENTKVVGLPEYFGKHTNTSAGPSLVIGGLSFDQAEKFVKELGPHPDMELAIRWGNLHYR